MMKFLVFVLSLVFSVGALGADLVSTTDVSTINMSRDWLDIESDWVGQAKQPDKDSTPDTVGSATKIYLLLHEGEDSYFHLGSLVTYNEVDRWEAPISLLRAGLTFGSLGLMSVEGFVEAYIDHEDSTESELEPHVVFAGEKGRVFGELDPALRWKVSGDENLAFGVLGFVAYRLNESTGVGLRTVADFSVNDEFVWLGPSVEFNTSIGVSGFVFAGFDTHGPVASTNIMLRLAGTL